MGLTNVYPELAAHIRTFWDKPTGEDVIEIHTTDRAKRKRCELQWAWSSPIHDWLEPVTEVYSLPTFIGNGGHFALEDYHGHRRFSSPFAAFKAYVEAFPVDVRPFGIDEVLELMNKHFSHYTDVWEPAQVRHGNEYETVWIDGQPLVEMVNHFKIGEGVVYSTMFDRVVKDKNDGIYIVDYKFVASRDLAKLVNDPQISAYCIMGYRIFGKDFRGVLFQQHTKAAPKDPLYTQTGKLSTDKRQNVTYASYLAEVKKCFAKDVPDAYVEMLNHLASQEDTDGDKFIIRTLETRSLQFCKNEWKNILREFPEMLDRPEWPIPNPTRDCSWDCAFREVCIMRMEGEDYLPVIEAQFKKRDQLNAWRDRVVYPTIH